MPHISAKQGNGEPHQFRVFSHEFDSCSSASSFMSDDAAEMTLLSMLWDARESEPDTPYQVYSWTSRPANHLSSSADDPFASLSSLDYSFFGYVYSGPALLKRTIKTSEMEQVTEFSLMAGMYFSCPSTEKFSIQGGSGLVIRVPEKTISGASPWLSSRPLFNIGGPEEGDTGRLPYIDGGTDTPLLPPVVFGAPCLNSMYFPTNTSQTTHTHPSGRIGIVIKGKATCAGQVKDDFKSKPEVVKSGADISFTDKHTTDAESVAVSMESGSIFVIPKDAPHAFYTDNASTLGVVVFHPDSDFGPSPKNHPMLNRTFVNGVSATELESIQTKK